MIVTKTDLAAYNYNYECVENNECDVMGDSLPQSPPIRRLLH